MTVVHDRVYIPAGILHVHHTSRKNQKRAKCPRCLHLFCFVDRTCAYHVTPPHIQKASFQQSRVAAPLPGHEFGAVRLAGHIHGSNPIRT